MSDSGFIYWFVFWIGVNALIGYAIGKSKNNILVCVLASVLLGPIGWLIALVDKGKLRKCPFCAEQIKPEANVCRYCGREVILTVALKPAVPLRADHRTIPFQLVRSVACARDPAAALRIVDHLRRRFARFKLGAHFL
jgi:hypothetical protein